MRLPVGWRARSGRRIAVSAMCGLAPSTRRKRRRLDSRPACGNCSLRHGCARCLRDEAIRTLPLLVPHAADAGVHASEHVDAPRRDALSQRHETEATTMANPHRCDFAKAAPSATAYRRGVHSLQKGPLERQSESLALEFDLRTLGPQINDFTDTLAILETLDLLITVDTSVAHLAGAAGLPVWMLIPTCADWRWLIDRTDSPWYPSMRLFRQSTPDDWTSVVETVRQALQRRACPREVEIS
jgi:hypothetical protein